MGFRFSTGVGPIRYSTRLGGGKKKSNPAGCGATILLFAVALGMSALVGFVGWAGALIVLAVAAASTGFLVWQVKRKRAVQAVKPPEEDPS